jgi:hypothetical protein
MANTIEALDVRRFDLIYSLGGAIPMRDRLRAVELYGTEVIPRVRELLADRPSAEQTLVEVAR